MGYIIWMIFAIIWLNKNNGNTFLKREKIIMKEYSYCDIKKITSIGKWNKET